MPRWKQGWRKSISRPTRTRRFFFVRFERQEKGSWTLVERKENILGKIPVVYGPAGKERVGRCAAPDRAFGKTVVQFCRYERLPRFAQDLRDGRDPRVCPQGGDRGDHRRRGQFDGAVPFVAQAPESVRLEISTLLSMIYSTTQTPDISFDSVKGLANLSGVALRMLFLDAHLKVQNKGELFGQYPRTPHEPDTPLPGSAQHALEPYIDRSR